MGISVATVITSAKLRPTEGPRYGGIAVLCRRAYCTSARGTAPAPISPGPTCAPMTGPISETNTGSVPKISRPASTSWPPLGRLDVLDDPAVGAVGVQRSAGSSTMRSKARARRAHALDRRDLATRREDRLDLQRRADPCLRARRCARRGAGTRACRPRTTIFRPLARLAARRRRTASRPPPAAGRVRRGHRHEPQPAARRRGVDDRDPRRVDPRSSAVAAWRARLHGAGDAAGDVDRDDVAARPRAAARRPPGSRRPTAARSSAARRAERRRS